MLSGWMRSTSALDVIASFAAFTAKPVLEMIELLEELICTPCDTPAASIQIVPNGVTEPMAASRASAPDDLSNRFLAAPVPSLLTMARSIVPVEPLVVIATSPVSVVAPARAIFPLAVISPARLLVPLPDWVNPPAATISPAARVEKVPECVMVMAPDAKAAEMVTSLAEAKVTAPSAPVAGVVPA